jgi:hypothetical protein
MMDGEIQAVVAAPRKPRLDVPDLPGGGFDAEGNWHDPGNGQFARRVLVMETSCYASDGRMESRTRGCDLR